MTDAVATDGPPPPDSEGARVSDRFQRMRIPALPTILFADASEDYRSMARDALLEGRNATDLRTVANGTEVLGYLERTGQATGAVTPAPSLIILDAHLPGTPAGHELIQILKRNPRTQHIPVVAPGPGRPPRDGRRRLCGGREHLHRQA